MKNFISDKTRGIRFFLFFSLFVTVVFAMDKKPTMSTISTKGASLKPQKKQYIFDPQMALEKGLILDSIVPGNVAITPDGKAVVFGYPNGTVKFLKFNDIANNDPIVLFEHPRVRHSPMIRMAQKKDASLLIVSAGNYMDSEKSKHVSEYILFCNGLIEVKKLDWPIQAMTLDFLGETLIVAGQRFIMAIDFATNVDDKMAFVRDKKNWMVDVAIKQDSEAVISCMSDGGVQYMSLAKKENKADVSSIKQVVTNVDLSSIKQVATGDIIKKIYYPNPQELLYITHDGKAKIIDMYDFLENTSVNVKTSTFAYSPVYDLVTADQGSQCATAHWTKNIRVAERIRRIIKIYRKNENFIEKFTLEVPSLEEKYGCITNSGQYELRTGLLLLIALCGNRVVALGTDGKMYLWSLPEKNYMRGGDEKIQAGSESVDKSTDVDLLLKRRTSSSNSPRKHNKPKSDSNEHLPRNIRRRSKTLSSDDVLLLREKLNSSESIAKPVKQPIIVDGLPKRRASSSSSPCKPNQVKSDSVGSIEKHKKNSNPIVQRFKVSDTSSSHLPQVVKDAASLKPPISAASLSDKEFFEISFADLKNDMAD